MIYFKCTFICMCWHWNAFAITLSFQGHCTNVLPQHMWMRVPSQLMLGWGPEALCPLSGSLPVPAFLLGCRCLPQEEIVMPPPTRDADQESWGNHKNILGTSGWNRTHPFKTRSNTHLGQLSQFILLPSYCSKLISHPLLPSTCVLGHGRSKETTLLH